MSRRIALDARFWRAETGGLGRYSRNLLTELLELDQENQYTAIITPADELEFKLNAPNLHRLVVDIPHYSTAEQHALLKVLNQEKFDLVHFAQFNHPILYRRPFVVTIHDIIMHLFPGTVQQKSWLHRAGFRAVFNDCKRARRIFVPSESTKNDLIEKLGFPREKINVTVEGSEATFRQHSAEEVRAIKEKYSLPERFLLFVSRWEAYKGLPILLQSFENLAKDYPDLGLVICGQPDKQNPDVAAQVEAAKGRGLKVITPGFVPDEDLAPLYSAAAVFVHPSWYEGFGIMILEAFASGVPVVTSNVSSLPEVVGDAGLLVDPKDPKDIAAKIRQVLDDAQLAESLKQKGLERVKQYSWRKMAEETLAIYQQVLAGQTQNSNN